MEESPTPAIDLGQIREAALRIREIAHRTPVLRSRSFDDAAGVVASFKCENFQRGGSFKIRGASNLIFSLDPEQLQKGVVAYSSGNHAQAVAIAARWVGAAATLVMPEDAPRSKVEATRSQGATIVPYDRLRESREAIGDRIAKESGATMVPPYEDLRIIAGQGTTVLELLEEEPQLDAVIAPIGGGGLLAGCATAAKSMSPGIRVFGAEPERANDTFLSLQAGSRIEIPPPDTIADGLRAQCPGRVPFPILQRTLERVLLVTEEEIRATVRYLLTRLKILVEPSGAAAAAAVLHGKLPSDVERIGVVLSGGNVDFEVLGSM